MKLSGKCAVVTGAATGIGEAYAHSLARHGASVVVADIDAAGSAKVAEDLIDAGASAVAVTADVTSEPEVDELVARATDAFGGVDILVNNAGLNTMQYFGPCTSIERSDWRRLLEVNVTGPLNCAAACRASMRERGGGVIINQSSVSAYLSVPSAYAVSKHALNGLTASLAAEFAPDGIRVNGIAPSTMESDSRPAMRAFSEEMKQQFLQQQLIQRFGRMDELAEVVVFLCSEESAFITGQTLLFDGGMVRRAG